MPRLSAEIEAKSSLGFEIGFGTRQIEIDCQNDVQNASKTTRFSTLKVPIVDHRPDQHSRRSTATCTRASCAPLRPLPDPCQASPNTCSSTILSLFWPCYAIAVTISLAILISRHATCFFEMGCPPPGVTFLCTQCISPDDNLDPNTENPTFMANVFSIWSFAWLTSLA